MATHHGWFGYCVSFGGQGVIGGSAMHFAVIYDLAKRQRPALIRAETLRLGLAIGGGGCVNLLLAANFKSPAEIHGHRESGADWAIDFGPQYSRIGRSIASMSGHLSTRKLVTAALKFRASDLASASLLEGLLMMPPSVIDYTSKILGQTLPEFEALRNNPGQKAIIHIPLPIGGGVEVGTWWGRTIYYAR